MPGLAAGGGAALPAEQPRPGRRRGPGQPRRLRRHGPRRALLARLPRDRGRAAADRRRGDAARAERAPRRRLPHARDGAARAARELAAGPRLGRLGDVPGARGGRAHDVRPDDRRLVDLHRHPGHRAGDVRDVRRRRGAALRRLAAGTRRADRGLRRHGRRAAPRGGDAGRRLPDRRRRLRPPAPPLRDALPRRRRARPRLGAARGRGGEGTGRGPLHRRRRRRVAGLRGRPRARRAARCRDRPDVGARPARRLRPDRHVAGRRRGAPRARPGGLRRRGAAVDGPPLRGDGRVPGRGRGRLRLRQQPAHGGEGRRLRARVLLPRLRAGVRAPAVLPRHRPVPLGGAERRAGRHRRHRRGHARAVPRERAAAALARPGRAAHRLPGPAGAHLLDRLRRPPPCRPALQRARRGAARCRRRS